jgi:hypothetical protein
MEILTAYQGQHFPEFMMEEFPGLEIINASYINDLDIFILVLNQREPSLFLNAMSLKEFCSNQSSSCLEYLLLNGDPPEHQKIVSETQQVLELINFTSAYKEIFSALWNAKIPCFETTDTKPPFGIEQISLLKSCSWKDVEIPCSKIFTTFPTDNGMCCTFNVKSADEIFVDSAYSNIIKELQNHDKNISTETTELPEFYVTDNEPQTRPGRNMGLRVILDAHSDAIESLSVTQNYEGFTGIITDPGSFILNNLGGFEIKPGHINQVALSAIVVDADENLKELQPDTRNCLFADETEQIRLHKNYSQENCFLECALFFAQQQLMDMLGSSTACTPWYFPIIDKDHVVCNPWEAQIISVIMQSQVPSNQCDYCRPDCRRSIYSMTISSQPFRRCDERSLEVSPMCSVLRKNIPKPEMWGKQVSEYLTEHPSASTPTLLSKITSSKRTIKKSFVLHDLFTDLYNDYDAYEKDIGVLNVYFDSTTVLKLKSEKRQTWIDYFSSVGGALGLCIGLSIVTIFEMLWVCLTMLKQYGKNPDRVELFTTKNDWRSKLGKKQILNNFTQLCPGKK